MANNRTSLGLRSIVPVVVICSLISMGADKPEPTLDGTWRGYAVEGKGEKPDRGPVHMELVVKGDVMTATQLGDTGKDLGEGTYTRGTEGDLKTMDGTRTKKPGAGQKYLGIYKVDGDTLYWCVGTPRNPRPKEFETKKGQFLVILKREKK